MRTLTIAAALVAMVGILAACDGDDSRPSAASTTSSSTTTTAPTTTTVAAGPCGGAATLPAAVPASPAAGLSQVPPANYTVQVQALTADGQYAKFAVSPTPAAAGTFQGGYGVAQCAGGAWTVLSLGSSDVGCPPGPGDVPASVRNELGLECS